MTFHSDKKMVCNLPFDESYKSEFTNVKLENCVIGQESPRDGFFGTCFVNTLNNSGMTNTAML